VAQKESGDVIAAGEIVAEVGKVVSGANPGRRSAEEVTVEVQSIYFES
jgi:ornithine cyclodeaminase/alanine dehydrogenase-like protein (mu-crystallin family)